MCRGLVVLLHGLNEHRSVIFYSILLGLIDFYFNLIFIFKISLPALNAHICFSNSGRYDVFAKKLNANGFKVYGMDWIGELKLLN